MEIEWEIGRSVLGNRMRDRNRNIDALNIKIRYEDRHEEG